jgi:hypothetical protein
MPLISASRLLRRAIYQQKVEPVQLAPRASLGESAA